MGPMSKRGKENTPGNVHIREKGWEGSGPIRGTEVGYINMEPQGIVGRGLFFFIFLVVFQQLMSLSRGCRFLPLWQAPELPQLISQTILMVKLHPAMSSN